MPIYEYKCPNGHLLEVFHGMNEPGPTKCEVCGASPLVRVLHPVAVHYKGSGFYSTDYGKGKAKKDGGGEAPAKTDAKPAEKKAFQTFMEEANRFYEIQAKNGVNLEGTFEVQEEIFFKRNLLSALEAFERGELPKYSAEEFQKSEAAEQATYLHTQNGPDSNWGTVTRESVHKSQDEWLRYRNAWIAFGRKKYPSVTEQSWKAWLDQDRTVMLNRFLR